MTDYTNTDTQSRYASRQMKISAGITASDLSGIILNPGPSLTYLTGLHFHLSERPVFALFIPQEPVIIILPELEAGKLDSLPFPFRGYPYLEDPGTWGDMLKLGLEAGKVEKSKIGVEPRRLRYLELSLLQETAPDMIFANADNILSSLRMYKDEREIIDMKKAAKTAQQAIQAVIPGITAGKHEKEIASYLVLELIQSGADFELPFSPIVSGGPNSANPHAVPGLRNLSPGDLLVIDWGAAYNGYFSDITRTFAIGKIDPEYQKIADIVLEANQAARAAVRPGILAKQVDNAARTIIDRAGYGDFFIHRTGHGLGLEGHEEPYIRADNDLLLEEGMTFTIEPGIYLPGRGGVRIEDDIHVTPDGCESLTDMKRELIHIE